MENTQKLEIRNETKDLKGTLEWWENLPKKVYIENAPTPMLFVEFKEGERQFLAEIIHEEDKRCRQIGNCNVTHVTGNDAGYYQALFYFPISKKAYEAIDKYIETEIEKFKEWWREV